MRKKLAAALAVMVVASACLTACSKTDTDAATAETATAETATGETAAIEYDLGLDDDGYFRNVTASKYIKMPKNYEKYTVSKDVYTVTDDAIQKELDAFQNNYHLTTEVTGRAAQNGDVVNIDYSGTVDGVAFNGGTYQGYDLTLGSGSFITGFEDQIVGHTTGDTFDVTVTFPDGYDASTDSDGNTVELSGKEAVFRVTVNSISEPVTPELTDEWVDSTFGTSDDVHTVEELKAFFSSALYDQNLEDAIMDALLDTADFKDVPKQISDYYACMFLNYYYQLASYYSSDLDTIAQAQGYTDANAMLGASDTVITHLAKQDLLYQAIAESQGIEPPQEQLDAAAASYSGSSYGDNFVHQTALQTAVMEWLKTNAVIS